MKKSARRRVSIDVSDELYDKLSEVFRWGERNDSLVRLLEWVVKKHEGSDPTAFYAVCRSGQFDVLLKEKEKHGDS